MEADLRAAVHTDFRSQVAHIGPRIDQVDRCIGRIVLAVDLPAVVAAAGIGFVAAVATPDADHLVATLEDVGLEVEACPVGVVAHQFEVAVCRVAALAIQLEVVACRVAALAFWLGVDFPVVVGAAMVAVAVEEARLGVVVEAAVEAATRLDTAVLEAGTAAAEEEDHFDAVIPEPDTAAVVFPNLAWAGQACADRLEVGTVVDEVKASPAAVAAAHSDEQALVPWLL